MVRKLTPWILIACPLVMGQLAHGQIGCPYEAARGLQQYYESHVAESRTTADKVAPDGARDWAYIRLGKLRVGKLIGGDRVSTTTKVDAPVLIYPQRKQKTFWMYDDKRELRHVGGKLLAEGVNDLNGILGDLGERRFVVVGTDDAMNLKIKRDRQLFATNTIIIRDRWTLKGGNYERFRQINERFLDELSPREFSKTSLDAILYIVVAKASADETIITTYSYEGTKETGKLLGEAYTVENDLEQYREQLRDEFEKLGKKKGIVVVYGDEPAALDLPSLADQTGVNLIRRSITVKKNLVETSERTLEIGKRYLDPNTVALMNAVPADEASLKAMGLPTGGLDEWRGFNRAVQECLKNKHATQLSSKAQFIKELTEGQSDILMVVVHNDGATIFIGGEKIAIEEIAKLPKRTKLANRPRLCVLVSCCAGKLSKGKRNWFLSMFAKEQKCLAEILIEKGFMDEVIAPDHEIDKAESLEALKMIIQARRIGDIKNAIVKGWKKLAMKGGPDEILHES